MSIRIDNDETIPVYESPTREKEDDEECDKGVGLKPTLTLFDGVMVITGCIIGSGIFINPIGDEHTFSMGFNLLIWVICGAFSAIGGYCYAELGTFIRESGGDYAYVLRAFGPLLAFIGLWLECIVVRPCTITAVAMTFATYIFRPFNAHCALPPYTHQLLTAGVIIFLCLINCISVKFVSLIQNIFTVAKLLALALIILTGLWLLYIEDPYLDSFENALDVPAINAEIIALAFYTRLLHYNGWNSLNMVTEEMINPTHDLARANVISCAICTVVYVLVTYTNKFYEVYEKFAFIMPFVVAGSCFGTVNGLILTSSRLFFAAGRNSHMPRILSYVNPYWNTPIPAVLFTAFLSLLYVYLYNMYSYDIYTLINYALLLKWLTVAIATLGLLWLRYKQPPSEYPRPLQVHLAFPIIFLIGCTLLVILPVIISPIDTAISIYYMLACLPVYFIFITLKGKLRIVDYVMDNLALFSQKLLLVVPGKKNA